MSATDAERVAAGRWLVKHRVDVPTLTELLALRLGFRAGARPPGTWRWVGVAALAYVVATIGFASLTFLPGVRGVDLVDSSYLFFIVMAQHLGYWLPARLRDRQALARFGTLAGPPRTEVTGWFLTVPLITFGGGAALAVTMFATTPFRTYAGSWLLLLAMGAAVTAAIVTDVLRRPVIAEDATSRAVDTAVRLHDLLMAMPGIYALPVLVDPLVGHAQPPEWRPWLVGYAVLAVTAQLVVGLVQWRRLRAVLSGSTPS
ncbi:hypothetical protein SAMN04489727_8704 [Amycolatopsis tolypomycina]|uniref:Uncharacterized protein n=1 Tax=Amycolatopsis tolypomycina TaxID=208445 RepID=A0A1H5CBP7_9PSEU|nr:hypothetical protein [Amycolatopsis tolypomycina]SED64209.1 hypothetical protein SAMN04489727_8704 [Amycolatopsis tolypomycina]